MAAREFNAEYDRIKGGDGRRYAVWKGTPRPYSDQCCVKLELY